MKNKTLGFLAIIPLAIHVSPAFPHSNSRCEEIYDLPRSTRGTRFPATQRALSPTFVEREDNDSFSNATALSAAGSQPASQGIRTLAIDAVLSRKQTGIWPWISYKEDKDFYSYDITATSTLTVKLTNVPKNADYDLRIYHLTNDSSTTYQELKFESATSHIAQSKSGGLGGDERCEIQKAKPGTYYFVVYPYDNYYHNDREKYRLEIKEAFDTANPFRSYNIEDGRRKGNLFAIWESDYRPLGIRPLGDFSFASRKQYNNGDVYPYIQHLKENHGKYSNYTYSVMYIWDLNTKKALYDIFDAKLKSLDSRFFDSSGNEFIMKNDEEYHIGIILNGTSLALTIAGLALNSVPFVGKAIALSGAALQLFSSLESALQNKLIISKRLYRNYLISLRAALETGTGSSEQKVVMIRSQYRFIDYGGKQYIDWTPILEGVPNNVYAKNTIGHIDHNSPINGTITGFRSTSELEVFLGIC